MRTLSDGIEMLDFAFRERLEYDAALLIPKKGDVEAALAILRGTVGALAQVTTFDHVSIEEALRALPESLAIKPRDMFGTVRVAVTGKQVSPPLFESMDILARERVALRLSDAIAKLAGALAAGPGQQRATGGKRLADA